MTLQRLQTLLLALTRRNDIALALILMAAVFMMVLPMPTALVDALVALNIGSAVVLLMVAVYIPSPLAFSAFPSVLLLSTVFRLALSIAITRLILLQADAGAIVDTFGNFVVAGNLVVGLVVFLIITLVQFIVITKGSERVAEVSARFSLDAMPGKQMSIEGDLRTGAITMEQARARRSRLERESQLYGATEGAMKFVKGDAIAGLCMIAVNILGGIAVGVLQQHMAVGEALERYTLLTVGDGLVAQIPALLIALTAGLIVTRVSDEEAADLGAAIGGQILAQPNALLVGAALLLGFALVPGFPIEIFIALGLGAGGMGMALKAAARRRAGVSLDNLPALAAGRKLESRPVNALDPGRPGAAPLGLAIAAAARPALAPELLNAELNQARQDLFLDLGVPFPGVDLRFESALDKDGYAIYLQGVPVARGRLGINQVLALCAAETLQRLNIPYREEAGFLPGLLAALWVDAQQAAALRDNGIGSLAAPQILGRHLTDVLRRHAGQLLGIQETHHLLGQLEPYYPELIKEALRTVPLNKVADVLCRLVAEDIPIRDVRSILEALIKWGPWEKEPVLLTEYVRLSLTRLISYRFSGGHNVLPAYELDSATEEMLCNRIRQRPDGRFLALEDTDVRTLLDTLGRLGAPGGQARHPALLTRRDIRGPLRRLIERDFPDIPVLSYEELAPGITPQLLGQIQLASGKADYDAGLYHRTPERYH